MHKYSGNIPPDILSVTASSTLISNVQNILEWDNPLGWVSDKFLDQYITLDFQLKGIYICGYSLKTYANDLYPKSWIVLGSNDGNQWTLIDNRTAELCEGSIGKRNPEDLFNVCKDNVENNFRVQNPGLFRLIRVQQVGYNSFTLDNEWKMPFYLASLDIFGIYDRPGTYTHVHCYPYNINYLFFIILPVLYPILSCSIPNKRSR